MAFVRKAYIRRDVKASPVTEDMRSAVRFPLELPVAVQAHSECFDAVTRDISAGGVLFTMASPVEVGSVIEFAISMPAKIIGAEQDVLVKCIGRVVRCSPDGDNCAVAAVIDEYNISR